MSEVLSADRAITIRAKTLLADPDTCKFTVSQTVYPGGPFFFDNKERAIGSPLVERLFALPGVANVLVTDNVVTVGKEPSTSWSELKSAIGTAIRTQLLTGVPTILDTPDNRSFTGVLTSTRDRRSSKHEVRVEIKRDCEVTMIPRGEMLTLWKGDTVVVTQALGGSFTVRTEMGYLVRVAALDADALGLEDTPEQEAPGEAGPFSLEKVIEKLKTVFDPEIPVNVVDLGLIYVCEAHPLADGGHRVEIKMSMTAPGCGMTVSLDSLDDATFRLMNDVDFPVAEVLQGIDVAHRVGIGPIKINMVVKKGINDQDIVPMARHFKDSPFILRFIEYMDVGATNGWKMGEVIPSAEVVRRIRAEMALEEIAPRYTGETSVRWRYQDGSGEIGVISSVTQAFCHSCTRARLSTEGKLYTCLFATGGHDLRALMRGGCSDEELSTAIAHIWRARGDRYSELRSAMTEGLLPAVKKIEMSYIGG